MDGKVPVLTGNLDTADPTIDLTGLPSGQYKLKLHILDAEEGEEDVDAERIITLYRKTDKHSPVKECPLWLTPLEQTVDKKNVGHITVGVSTPKAYIYYVASTCDEVISQGWLTYNKGMNDFTVQLPKEAGKDVTIKFITYYGTKLWEETVTLQNPYKAEAVNVTATSFRDKLVPGDMEHWTFSITDQNGKPVRAAMMLDMFDKAIASIADNNWGFNNWRPNFNAFRINATSLEGTQSSWASWTGKMLDYNGEASVLLPWLYTYQQGFFKYNYGRERRLMTKMKGVADVSHGMGMEADQAAMSIRLEENNATLNEVMVTSYGKAKKSSYTGSNNTKEDKNMTSVLNHKPMILDLRVDGPNGRELFLHVTQGSKNNLKPETVLAAFAAFAGQEFDPYGFSVCRSELYMEDGRTLAEAGQSI